MLVIFDQILGVYIQFLMRNPIFRSKMKESGVQKGKLKKNVLRKIDVLISLFLFVLFFYRFMALVSRCTNFSLS